MLTNNLFYLAFLKEKKEKKLQFVQGKYFF